MLLNREKGGRLSCFQCGNTDLILTHDGEDDDHRLDANLQVECPACNGMCPLLEEDEMQLSEETLESLEESRKDFEEGKFVSFDELVKSFEEEDRKREEATETIDEGYEFGYKYAGISGVIRDYDKKIYVYLDHQCDDWGIGDENEVRQFTHDLTYILEKIKD